MKISGIVVMDAVVAVFTLGCVVVAKVARAEMQCVQKQSVGLMPGVEPGTSRTLSENHTAVPVFRPERTSILTEEIV